MSNSLSDYLVSALQGASNAAASNVTGPVDALAWALRKAGVPVPSNPILGSEWMKQKGLMAEPQNKLAGLLGEGVGLAAPFAVAAKAPQIAGGLLRADDAMTAGANRLADHFENTAAAYRYDPKQRGIVSVGKAQGLNTQRALPQDQLFADAVANTPGAQISGDGLLMRVQRNQAPEQGMRPSVRGGVFYLPEGAAQAKHYSTGRNGYGGSEKIAGETMVSNPVFVKGATGGKAPEAAFDQLSGKGAYQAMREDALRALGSYGTSPADKVARVESFLEKYAPELKDQAAYIVSNSKTGNQLPYALQEAAVASKVRNAGHDAVLGYSKSKSGSPFLSELFDVREAYYPDKFGGSKIWPQYESGAVNALAEALKGPR